MNASGHDTAPETLSQGVAAIESSPAADDVANFLAPIADQLHQSGARSLLRGDWLGHAAHPMMTDIPLGCFTAATLLDLFGGRRSAKAAQRLIGVGLLALPPTVATGMVDWKESGDDQRIRRVGAVHAAGNLVAGFVYLRSWQARRRGHRFTGIILALLGGVLATATGYLGGHLSFARGASQGERGLEESERAHAYPPSDWATPGTGPELDPSEEMIREAPIPR